MADIIVDTDRIVTTGTELRNLIGQAAALIAQLGQVKTRVIEVRDRIQTETGTFTPEDLTAVNSKLVQLNNDLKTLAGCP